MPGFVLPTPSYPYEGVVIFCILSLLELGLLYYSFLGRNIFYRNWIATFLLVWAVIWLLQILSTDISGLITVHALWALLILFMAALERVVEMFVRIVAKRKRV